MPQLLLSVRKVHLCETFGRWWALMPFYLSLYFPQCRLHIIDIARAYLNDDSQRRRSIEIPKNRGRVEKSMARKAGEHRCKAHLCCRPTRKMVKNAVMTHCPRIACDNYTPLRPTRYSLFFRSCLRIEARCGRSQPAVRIYVRQFFINYSITYTHNFLSSYKNIVNTLSSHYCKYEVVSMYRLVLRNFVLFKSNETPYIMSFKNKSNETPYIMSFKNTKICGHLVEIPERWFL